MSVQFSNRKLLYIIVCVSVSDAFPVLLVEPLDSGSGGVSGGGGSSGRAEEETMQQDELRHGRTQSANGSWIQPDQRPHSHPVHTGETR